MAIKKLLTPLILFIFLLFTAATSYADTSDFTDATMDRAELVSQQVDLLKNRVQDAKTELATLQQQHDKEIGQPNLNHVNKSFLDKAALDISVAASNLDNINMELTDVTQSVSWLEKNIQEMDNQLNVLGIFGIKNISHETVDVQQLRQDLDYQTNLLTLEKTRLQALQNLQTVEGNILQLKKDQFNRLATLFKSQTMLNIKQQQVKDELAYQEQQAYWLQQVNKLYKQLANVNPITEKANYTALENSIFYANENANIDYMQSLIARYKDQIAQIKLAMVNGNSITLLNDVADQIQTLNKQIARLGNMLQVKLMDLDKRTIYLNQTFNNSPDELQTYTKQLATLKDQSMAAKADLADLGANLQSIRRTMDQELKSELSARQGFPSFDFKMLLDLGKELLLIPTLTFNAISSLTMHIVGGFYAITVWQWMFVALTECLVIFAFFFLKRLTASLLNKPADWHDQLNTKWLSLSWLQRNLLDIFIIGNIYLSMLFLRVAESNYIFIIYLALVWLACKSILTIARLCLVETTHSVAGRDVRLYRRLVWMIIIGGIITAATVFLNQLPLLYQIKMLCDRLFLLLLMIVSLFLLFAYDIVANLIISGMDLHHPYIQKSVRTLAILIPLLIVGNSVVGLIGYVNLIMTVSWYEGIFLVVLIGYLILRGLLSDGMEQLSRLMIQYVHNGWLWTEAVLKPVDKILRVGLFLIAGALLYGFYGWDRQTPIVARFNALLHSQLFVILKTGITPLSIIKLAVVVSVFYWTAKWTREFVYRLLLSRTKDMGIRNSIAILSQYSVVVLGVFIALRVLGINLQALAVVAGMFAFGVGIGLRDLANNFACGFLILLERPVRVGDIVNINSFEGEVVHIGSRAITVQTWDHMEHMVPNTEIFNKSFTNLTAHDNVVRCITTIKIDRCDNPHQVKLIIHDVVANHKDVLPQPGPEIYLREIGDNFLNFEIRFFVNIRQIFSRAHVTSSVLINIWDAFEAHGIKQVYPQQEIHLRQEPFSKV